MTTVRGSWLENPATQGLMVEFEEAGHKVFFVGGCVRNALLGVPVADIDLATDANPERIIELVEMAGLKAIPTGIDHGTITVVAGSIPHEITTFRADQETDGRHAKVAFSTDPKEDATRRDFTMNGLYADRHGEVRDWVGGLADAKARKVRFIGDPNFRIAEDYLRILRFFRFHAWYGDPDEGIDANGLAACSAGQDGIAKLSAERVGTEMQKLLSAKDPSPAVAAMAQSGILARVLPGSDDRSLAPLVHFENGRSTNWLRRAAVLGGETPAESWRLSRQDARALTLLRKKIGTSEPVAELAFRHGADIAIDVALCRAAIFETSPPEDFEADAKRGAVSIFPIKAKDLPELEGPALGARLKELEAKWIASDFNLTREDLLK